MPVALHPPEFSPTLVKARIMTHQTPYLSKSKVHLSVRNRTFVSLMKEPRLPQKAETCFCEAQQRKLSGVRSLVRASVVACASHELRASH